MFCGSLGEVFPCGAFVFPPLPPRPFHPRRGERGAKADSRFCFCASTGALQAQRLNARLGASFASVASDACHAAPLFLSLPALGTVGLKPAPTITVAASRLYGRIRREAIKSAVRLGSPFTPAGVKGAGGIGGAYKSTAGNSTTRKQSSPPTARGTRT